MKRIRKLPTPAMIVAVIALVFALAGTAIGAKKLLGLGSFRDGVKNKTVGVGKLQYVTATATDDNADLAPKVVVATCPGNYEAVGGGIKGEVPATAGILDSYPTSSGWSGRVSSAVPPPGSTTYTIVAVCARSRAITGTPPTG